MLDTESIARPSHRKRSPFFLLAFPYICSTERQHHTTRIIRARVHWRAYMQADTCAHAHTCLNPKPIRAYVLARAHAHAHTRAHTPLHGMHFILAVSLLVALCATLRCQRSAFQLAQHAHTDITRIRNEHVSSSSIFRAAKISQLHTAHSSLCAWSTWCV